MNTFLSALLCTSLLLIANLSPVQAATPIDFEVLAERTHKPSLFTQGLLVDGDYFYESSGLYGKSLLVAYPIKEPASTWAKISAPFIKKGIIPNPYFAEGLALLNEKLYLLTWQEKTVFVHNKETLAYERRMSYEGEGWGLTSDGKQLIRSDGSATLFFHNADNFAVTRTLSVIDGITPTAQLNELEFAQGFIWANIWHQDRIVKIDPESGKVVGELRLEALKKELKLSSGEQVLNGIAWDPQQRAFWITGKLWPKMFLVRPTSQP